MRSGDWQTNQQLPYNQINRGRALSMLVRALALHAGGRRFEPDTLRPSRRKAELLSQVLGEILVLTPNRLIRI